MFYSIVFDRDPDNDVDADKELDDIFVRSRNWPIVNRLKLKLSHDNIYKILQEKPESGTPISEALSEPYDFRSLSEWPLRFEYYFKEYEGIVHVLKIKELPPGFK